MRKSFFLLTLIGFLTVGCKKQEQIKGNDKDPDVITHYSSKPIDYLIANNYTLNNEFKTSKGLNLKITSQEQFDKYFKDIQETKVKTIDFKNYFVLAFIGITSKTETSFKVESIKDKNNKLEIKYCINEIKEPLKEAVYPYSIILIDKKFQTKDIHFVIH